LLYFSTDIALLAAVLTAMTEFVTTLCSLLLLSSLLQKHNIKKIRNLTNIVIMVTAVEKAGV
jgi:hypothetical protein